MNSGRGKETLDETSDGHDEGDCIRGEGQDYGDCGDEGGVNGAKGKRHCSRRATDGTWGIARAGKGELREGTSAAPTVKPDIYPPYDSRWRQMGAKRMVDRDVGFLTKPMIDDASMLDDRQRLQTMAKLNKVGQAAEQAFLENRRAREEAQRSEEKGSKDEEGGDSVKGSKTGSRSKGMTEQEFVEDGGDRVTGNINAAAKLYARQNPSKRIILPYRWNSGNADWEVAIHMSLALITVKDSHCEHVILKELITKDLPEQAHVIGDLNQDREEWEDTEGTRHMLDYRPVMIKLQERAVLAEGFTCMPWQVVETIPYGLLGGLEASEWVARGAAIVTKSNVFAWQPEYIDEKMDIMATTVEWTGQDLE
ncbi:hypothetical protein CBR_g45662 [Chara braunii]|uniref:Uncharacterized protein n=1 Tax=Chara braunii TaxID=69332 RepID=A0A388K3J6_CHABU|nr:hypothetical protein CBR_g45662 [Chara braunii]|eukprot:GBG64605.1 hypothetical protein CBR_g45662 [Chara braunii]